MSPLRLMWFSSEPGTVSSSCKYRSALSNISCLMVSLSHRSVDVDGMFFFLKWNAMTQWGQTVKDINFTGLKSQNWVISLILKNVALTSVCVEGFWGSVVLDHWSLSRSFHLHLEVFWDSMELSHQFQACQWERCLYVEVSSDSMVVSREN